MFYVNAHYFAFVDRIRKAGIQVPVVAGLMPVTNIAADPAHRGAERRPSSRRSCAPGSSGCRTIPRASLAVAVEWTTAQCAELLRGGCPGIHFYTLNQSPATRAIFEHLRARGPRRRA